MSPYFNSPNEKKKRKKKIFEKEKNKHFIKEYIYIFFLFMNIYLEYTWKMYA